MTCPGCGSGVQPSFAFCPACGRKLPVSCPSCGFGCEPGFAFCPKCGNRLAAAAPPVPAAAPAATPAVSSPRGPAGREEEEADRRPVTVLFADVSGFTALSEHVDPEEIRNFQNDLFQELAAVVRRFDGFVEKFVGDAVMVAFGAPVAHEDDPERALRTALAMRERMTALSGRWERRFGCALTLHIGINTGPVVAGALGGQSNAAYAVTGDTVNTAARLQSAAGPDEILVAETTCRFTRHLFELEAVRDLTVKGKALPLQASRLLGAREAPAPARGLEAHGLKAPLVGRDAELDQLLSAFERMRRGQAQVVSLAGEAGVGKSRLIQEFIARLESTGGLESATVRHAVCSSFGEQPYGVVASFVREAFGIDPGEAFATARDKLATAIQTLGFGPVDSAQLARLLGYVLGFEPDHTLGGVEPEQLKRQIHLVVRTLVERRLERGPLLLLVEDLHWADAASVEVLRFLADRLASRPLLMLFTYRPAFDAGSLVTGRTSHTVIRLDALDQAGSEAILRGLFGAGSECLSPALRRLILERAGGHPFYLEEIVRSFIARGILVRTETGWTCAGDAPTTVDVPATLQGMLLARLDRLPAPARRLLQEAAVIGPTFDARLLHDVSGSPATIEPTLATLVEADLVHEATDEPRGAHARYRFAHTLVQEVAYDSMLVRRRTELHGQVGRALEALLAESAAPERLEDLALLGHHFCLGGDRIKGARYFVAAGDRAHAVYANDDAVRHYERALDALATAEPSDPDRLVAHERLADLLGPIGRRDDAFHHYETVRRAAEQRGDIVARARMHRKTARLHWDAGDRKQALADFQAGLGFLEGHSDDIELAHLYQEVGRLMFRSGDSEAAVDWAERALASARRIPEGSVGERDAAAAISHAYNTLGVALARMGRVEEAVDHIKHSVAVATDQQLLAAACRAYANLGVLYSTLDPGQAIETCRTGLETARRIGDLGLQAQLQANLAVAYCNLTNQCDDEGLAAARTAIDLDRQLGQLDHLAVPLIVLGQIHHCHGEPDLALGYYREALEVAEAVGEPQLLFPCYDGLAALLLDLGDQGGAEEYMKKAQQICERAGIDPDSLAVLPFLA